MGEPRPVAIAILLLGVVALLLPAFGPGIVIAGVTLVVLYLLDLPKVEQKLAKPPPEPAVGVVSACRASDPTPRTDAAVLYIGRTAQHEPTRAEAYTPEWIAITPLLALAATAVTATVEAALSTGWRDLNTWSPALPTLVLAVLAVVLTGVWPNDPHAINRYHRLSDRWLWLTLGILALTLLVFAGALGTGYDAWLLAVYGLLWLVVRVLAVPSRQVRRRRATVRPGQGDSQARGVHKHDLAQIHGSANGEFRYATPP